jgi:hypothetical protein
VTVSGGNASRVFLIDGVEASISGMTITGGMATGSFPDNSGGGLLNAGGTLTLTNVTVTGTPPPVMAAACSAAAARRR